MDVASAKLIGAGISVIALSGVGIGLGHLFASVITALSRNPSVAAEVKGTGLLYFALIEAIALYALVIALLLLFLF